MTLHLDHSSGFPLPEGKILSLRGVRTRCLKNISLDLPLRRWITIVGVSGAGKSSLACDTILAEAHRRYLESLSLSTRRYFERVERPDVDRIDGLPPCLSVGPQSLSRGPRATVSTILNLQELLASLFARLGTVFCPRCLTQVRNEPPQAAADRIARWTAGTKLQFAFRATDREELLKRGFTRFVSEGSGVGRLSDSPELCIVDRQILPASLSAEAIRRIAESIALCYRHGEGTCHLLADRIPDGETATSIRIDGLDWYRTRLTSDPECTDCGKSFVVGEPRLFSFRSPLGACPQCRGTGKKTLGSTSRKGDSSPGTCDACEGTRLCPEARHVRIRGDSIDRISALDGVEIRSWLEALQEQLTPDQFLLVARPVEELRERISILERLGLRNLTWNRSTNSLSVGERERLSLATMLAHRTVHALYLLDEPTRGLHPLDRLAVIDAIGDLRNRGNTLLLIEHDPLFIEKSDWIVELGPGSGERGGQVIYSGPPESFVKSHAPFNRSEFSKPDRRIRTPTGKISLSRIDADPIEFHLGILTVVTGVSGSGKSGLITGELADALRAHLERRDGPLVIEAGQIDEMICMDESPARISSHSSTATLLNIWPEIRRLFAATDEARRRNFKHSDFSLSRNSPGRCSCCEGRGMRIINLQFLPDFREICPECRGKRFRTDLLEVTFRGLTIAEILDLEILQALTHFRGEHRILGKLTSAMALGLDSLRLGQPASELSSGERQRLRLAQHLGKRTGRRCIFLLDEPTCGLHPADVERLVAAIDQLVSAGHGMVVIDHHPQLLEQADEILDLGTRGGMRKAEVVGRGALADLISDEKTSTGAFYRISR